MVEGGRSCSKHARRLGRVREGVGEWREFDLTLELETLGRGNVAGSRKGSSMNTAPRQEQQSLHFASRLPHQTSSLFHTAKLQFLVY